jgi:hypothetical protein
MSFIISKEYPSGKTRKIWRIVFLSYVTLGVFYYLYQLWIFQDLMKHYEKAFKSEPNAYPTKVNPVTLFIFSILLPVYAIYTKYQLLHEHIATSNIPSQENCKSGYRALLLYLLFGLITLWIVPIVLEIKWQKAFNEHILDHEHVAEWNNKQKKS